MITTQALCQHNSRFAAAEGPLPPPATEFEVYAGADDVLVERDRGVGAA